MAVNGITVTQEDINLVLLPTQTRYVMIQVLSQDGMRLFNIDGDVVSCSVNIDATSNIRYTGSITMRCTEESIKYAQQLSTFNYVRIFSGIENPHTDFTKWYNEGTFIINQQGISLSITDRTLSLSLSDKMLDFTGDRKGKLHAYSAIVEYEQRFDEVMEKLVRDFGGVKEYDITPIHPTFTASAQISADKNDYLIPMKLEFSVGVTIYEILEKLVNCYSDWQIFFDVDGRFICQPSIRAQQNIEPSLYDEDIVRLKISESAELVDVSKIKNVIEVWGKDGHYYGEARDDNPDSPTAVSAVGEFREVFSGGDYDNIYDRYKDVEKYKTQQEELAKIINDIAKLENPIQHKAALDNNKKILDVAKQSSVLPESLLTSMGAAYPSVKKSIDDYRKSPSSESAKKVVTDFENAYKEDLQNYNKEMGDYKILQGQLTAKKKAKENEIAMNIKYKGDDMAQEWAEFLLWEKSRNFNTSTLTLVYCPFINNVGFKITYRDDVSKQLQTYIVNTVAHDLVANTTTLGLTRYYSDVTNKTKETLPTPEIVSYNFENNIITVTVDDVPLATKYNLWLDNSLVMSSTNTTITFDFNDYPDGTYNLYVTSWADGFNESLKSEAIPIEIINEEENNGI